MCYEGHYFCVIFCFYTSFLTHKDFEPVPEESAMQVTAMCKLAGKTGVEMEALTAATVALLTIYDMCKGVDRGMVISDVRLMEKRGGQSGVYQRPE